MAQGLIFSDASSFASAGFTCEKQQKIVHYMWDEIEQMKSSAWRELKSICIIIDSLQSFLCGKLVKVYTDNQTVVHIACKGVWTLSCSSWLCKFSESVCLVLYN